MSSVSVLACGEGWVAIDKPFDVSVHNAESSHLQYDAISLVNDLLNADSNLSKLCKVQAGFAPSPVHRLDVGTSGVLLMALSKARAADLAQAFSNKETQKTYLAALKGKLASDTLDWTYALTDKAEGRTNPAGRGEKKPCQTRVKKIKESLYFSLAQIVISTGRTHQIRRHAALAKHPVIGDTRYGSVEYAKKITQIYGVNRLALHAKELVIKIDNKQICIQSPEPEFVAKLFISTDSQ